MTLKACTKRRVCRSATADESGFKEGIPDFGILPSRFEAFLDCPETVADVETIVQQMMEKISDDWYGRWFFGLVLDKEHDIDIGGEAKLLPTISTKCDGCHELLVRVCERPENRADEVIETLCQGHRNGESASTPTMEADNRL
jgi:hypothetical protein